MADSASSLLGLSLSRSLPLDLRLSVYHLCSAPTKTTPLYSAPPSKKPAHTTVEPHFLAISYDAVLVFAVELLLYVCEDTQEQTIFVSKADSSGYLPPSKASFSALDPKSSIAGRESTLRTIATVFIEHILNGCRKHSRQRKTTIALFVRSQSQYLFPNSASNRKKHVLTDRGLISWWCKVLDPVYQSCAALRESAKPVSAHLFVPGIDSFDTRKLLPQNTDGRREPWILGHPFVVDNDAGLTVREVIPHFPDDPKARYLDELNGDEDEKKGIKRGRKWKDITSVETFWEHMSFRQECSLGRCVGFVWIVIDRNSLDKAEPTPVTSSRSVEVPQKVEKSLSTSTIQEKQAVMPENPAKCTSELRGPPEVPTESKETNILRKEVVIESPIVLDKKHYQRVMDSLLRHSDFGDIETAKEGSRNWIERVCLLGKEVGDVQAHTDWDWGEEFTGTVTTRPSQQPSVTSQGQVNVLSVRKKAKTGDNASVASTQVKESTSASSGITVNVLSGGLVRKKRKVEQ